MQSNMGCFLLSPGSECAAVLMGVWASYMTVLSSACSWEWVERGRLRNQPRNSYRLQGRQQRLHPLSCPLCGDTKDPFG